MSWARTAVTRSPVAQPPTNTSDSHRSPSACAAISTIARFGLSKRETSITAVAPPTASAPFRVRELGPFGVHRRETAARRISNRQRRLGAAFRIREGSPPRGQFHPDVAIPGSSFPKLVPSLLEEAQHALSGSQL